MQVNPPEAQGKAAGFTLIEVILVVLIVGIIISMAGLSIHQGGGDRLVAEEAKRVAALFNLLSQEAIVSGNQFAVRVHQQGYEFWTYREEGWVLLDQDWMFKPHSWEGAVQVALDVEGEKIRLPLQGAMEPVPQIYLFSSGEKTAYQMLFAFTNASEHKKSPPWLVEGGYLRNTVVRELSDEEWSRSLFY